MSYHNNSSNTTNTNSTSRNTTNTSLPVQSCSAISVDGYFPLYTTIPCAQTHMGGNGTYHTHLLNSVTYYMPSGLVLGVTFFHGNYGVTTTVTDRIVAPTMVVDTRVETTIVETGSGCNEIYYHLFSMCHKGVEPYNFQQGSVVIWEGSPNYITENCDTTNLHVNNTDFYLGLGQPSVGQSVGISDRVGISCMIYVGYIPFPVVNPAKLTKLVTSTSIYNDCSSCIDMAIKGCVDSLSNNYNPLATVDEGGCEYTNLPCKSCCVDVKGNQYTPSQPCICESGYVLNNTPCVVPTKTEICKECCYNEIRGVYRPSNYDCSCKEGDRLTACREKSDLVLSACTNCCTNKSRRIFNPKPTLKYGCACLSGSWSVPCDSDVGSSVTTYIGEVNPTVIGCIETACGEGYIFDNSICGCVSTLVDTCENKIDSTFNETLAYLPISNHLDIIRNSLGGHTKLWSTYKFKHYPTAKPTNHSDICLAIDSWGDVQDAYWTYVKNVVVSYVPEGSESAITSQLTNFSDLYTYTASTLPVELDKTKEVWEAMELWNNDTTIWTPGLFSLTYSLVYCNCYDSGVLPENQKPRATTEKVVRHVFGGTEGVYIEKEDNLQNYKCSSGTNPIVEETQNTCVPTSDKVGVGVYDNVIDCVNSGCGGYMSCNPGVIADGVKFDEDRFYTPIVMCCERLIMNSKEPLTRKKCQSECSGTETWYPLYNAFAPNIVNESLLGYMVRDLLNKVNNRECSVSRDNREFRAMGYVERLK